MTTGGFSEELIEKFYQEDPLASRCTGFSMRRNCSRALTA